MPIKTICLDMEGTLISTHQGVTARPYLFDFLEFCFDRFERVAIYTLLSEEQAHSIVQLLVQHQFAPPVFLEKFEYIHSRDNYKNLLDAEINIEEVILIDDNKSNIKPGQEDSWIEIQSFSPYSSAFGKAKEDQELLIMKDRLAQILQTKA